MPEECRGAFRSPPNGPCKFEVKITSELDLYLIFYISYFHQHLSTTQSASCKHTLLDLSPRRACAQFHLWRFLSLAWSNVSLPWGHMEVVGMAV